VLPKVEQIWIVMDFLEGGSLMDYVSPEQVSLVVFCVFLLKKKTVFEELA
jgi:hypothetical protein